MNVIQEAIDKGFTQWFNDYPENKGFEIYLDDLPIDLYLTLIQAFLRSKKIEVRVWAEYYTDGINWCTQALKWNLALRAKDFIEDSTFQYGDNNEYPTYELALQKGIYEGLKLLN